MKQDWKELQKIDMEKQIRSVARLLRRDYRDFRHFNRDNPLEELIFIILSVRTTENNYRHTYAALRRELPTFQMIADAPTEAIARSIAYGGLSNQKADAIKRIFDKLIAEFGRPTLAPLRNYSEEQCEAFLTRLPGVGKKVARCVMLYSLDRKTFPVDTHCWRICQRLGWIEATTKDSYPTANEMDFLQSMIPSSLRFSLHVNMVSLGRRICTVSKPKCSVCPIRKYCKKTDVLDAPI